MTHPGEAARRGAPRLWDTDWLMLRDLGRALERQIAGWIARGERVLDFGCGTMPYRSLVEGAGAVYVAADFAPIEVQISSDGRLPLGNGAADAVLSVQVLEHVRDLDRYLGEAHRVLRDGGLLLLSTHGNWLFHPHPEDHRRWTRTGLIVDIEARGFEVDAIEAIVGPLATTTLIRLAGFAFFLRRLPITGDLLASALAVLMNARAWLEDRVTPRGLRDDNGCMYLVRCRKRLPC